MCVCVTRIFLYHQQDDQCSGLLPDEITSIQRMHQQLLTSNRYVWRLLASPASSFKKERGGGGVCIPYVDGLGLVFIKASKEQPRQTAGCQKTLFYAFSFHEMQTDPFRLVPTPFHSHLSLSLSHLEKVVSWLFYTVSNFASFFFIILEILINEFVYYYYYYLQRYA